MSESLTISIEIYFERLKNEFGYEIVLVQSFCTGGILPAVKKNVLKELGFTNTSSLYEQGMHPVLSIMIPSSQSSHVCTEV